jgi:hypothetical protein
MRLDPTTFDAVAATLKRSNPRTIEAMRAIYVEGKEPYKVGKEFGMAGGDIYRKKSFFEAALQRYMGVPDGWVTITVSLPKSRAAEIVEEVSRLRARLLQLRNES